MMTAMDISSRAEFAAPVEEIFAMMTDQTYLEEVCKASRARSYEASVTGTTTRTSRRLPSPESAARFTGPELTVVEEVAWGPADADGSRTGRVDLTIKGQPVTMRGSMRLAAGGPGTVADLTGELKVAIPILGKKLEQSSAPAVLAGFRTQQKVGNDWLARR
jgi:Protein of unknown function (DUF2505)